MDEIRTKKSKERSKTIAFSKTAVAKKSRMND